MVNLLPGASSSAVVNISSPANAADGIYGLGLSAWNSSEPASSASTQATYTVVSRLAVSTVTNSSSYSRTQKVTITTRVTVLGSNLIGVPVTMTLSKPNGSSVTLNAVISKYGTAVWNYSFNKRTDPIGVYRVDTVSSKNGITGNASTSFNVTK